MRLVRRIDESSRKPGAAQQVERGIEIRADELDARPAAGSTSSWRPSSRAPSWPAGLAGAASFTAWPAWASALAFARPGPWPASPLRRRLGLGFGLRRLGLGLRAWRPPSSPASWRRACRGRSPGRGHGLPRSRGRASSSARVTARSLISALREQEVDDLVLVSGARSWAAAIGSLLDIFDELLAVLPAGTAARPGRSAGSFPAG